MSSRKKKPEQTHTDNQPERSKQPTPAANQPEPLKPSTRAVKQPVESNQSISSAKQLAGSKQSTGTVKQPVQSKRSVSAAKPPAKAKESARPEKPSVPPALQHPPQYERFPLTQRIAHAFLLASFTLLAITGLPQKFAQAHWAQAMIAFFGGIETTRMIHHVSAIVLMLLAVYHLMDIGYKIFVRRTSLTMLPTLKDIKDALQAFLYNLGFGKTRPQMGRYTFEEKAEYWALIWGTVIMAITGFMMWNPIFTARLLPGEIIPAAKAAHGGEALLAVMAIVVWHMYGVHVRRFNKAMWTGKQNETEMLHEHPLELADIKSGLADRPVDGQTLRKRRLVYFPIASVLAAVMLFGIYGFMTGEKTAITTVLPISNPVPIYAPQTPTPLPTAPPTPTSAASGSSALTWDGSIGQLFQARCSMCHGTKLATNGLSFATFADAIKGAQDGPVIIPGNVEGSKLIVIQSANDHPGQFSVDELTLIQNWIAAGALEK